MKTRFAPAERLDTTELSHDIKYVANNPVIDVLMHVSSGLFAVLNAHRQIIALNETFLNLMGIEDSGRVLGLRPGEYVRCIHANELPGGCGTSSYCSTCGAVISILAAIDSDVPQERNCAITLERDNQEVDLFFQVRCCPLRINKEKFIMLFLQDISIQQQRAVLERTFFHDINNILCGIMGRSEFLASHDEMHSQLHHSILRLAQEMSIQRSLLDSFSDSYKPFYMKSSANRILNELKEIFVGNPLVAHRNLIISQARLDIPLVTDQHLVSRILTNMVSNALEATEPGGKVKVDIEPGNKSVIFSVWNKGTIPADISKRIFQRNFSSKQSFGRGLGTYSMKFFGEKVLGGKVEFTSNSRNGTVFRFSLLSND